MIIMSFRSKFTLKYTLVYLNRNSMTKLKEKYYIPTIKYFMKWQWKFDY